VNYLPGLALNCDPPDLCPMSSKDYRCESPAPGLIRLLHFLNQFSKSKDQMTTKCGVTASLGGGGGYLFFILQLKIF
jgi:hypothetical protein